MQVDRARVHLDVRRRRRRRCRAAGRWPSPPPRPGRRRCRAGRRRAGPRCGPVPAGGPAGAACPAATSASSTGRAASPPNRSRSAGVERQLGGGAAQVRAEHVRVGRVEHGRLDRRGRTAPPGGAPGRCRAGRPGPPARTSASSAGAAGPARLLPQRGQGARVAGEQHRVQPGHVDAELQRVGGGQAEQRAVEQRLLQGAPLLAQVAGPVGGHPVAELGHRLVQRPAGRASATTSAPRRERTKASVRTPSATASASRSAVSIAAAGRAGSGRRRRRPVGPWPGSSGGSQSANGRPPRAAARRPRSRRVTGRPVSRAAAAPGRPAVAEAEDRTRGAGCAAAYRAATPAQPAETWATCEPNTPR